jgi:hypothetical protein
MGYTCVSNVCGWTGSTVFSVNDASDPGYVITPLDVNIAGPAPLAGNPSGTVAAMIPFDEGNFGRSFIVWTGAGVMENLCTAAPCSNSGDFFVIISGYQT